MLVHSDDINKLQNLTYFLELYLESMMQVQEYSDSLVEES